MKTPSIVLKEMEQVISRIDKQQYDDLVSLLNREVRFFVFGEGRSGLIGK